MIQSEATAPQTAVAKRSQHEPPAASRWVLLLPSIPSADTSARVKVWRQLQKVGAIALKNSVYVLPNRDECVEAFQWVARELSELGGQASLCEGRFFDGVTDQEIERRFSEVRNADYAEISTEARRLAKALKAKRLPSDKLTSLATQLKKLQRRLADVIELDFCYASGREAAQGLVSAVERILTELGGDSAPEPLDRVSRPVGATWVTRSGVHIDRIACSWLIRRFIDPKASFKFVAPKGYVPEAGELRFDMYEAEFTHVGDRCSFEVLLARMRLGEDAGLLAIAEIIHDIDLKDDKYMRPETAGVQNMVTGICGSIRDDEARIAAASPVLDGLYAFFSRPSQGR